MYSKNGVNTIYITILLIVLNQYYLSVINRYKTHTYGRIVYINKGARMQLLKQRMTQYINECIQQTPTQITLYKEEIEYAEKHQLIPNGVHVLEKSHENRFETAHLERCEKETIALIIVEAPIFMKEKIDHLKTHQREFLYVESPLFNRLGVDALSMEVDDVFGTYTALFGLKMKKQYETALKQYLEEHLVDERGKFSVSFSGEDGLWNMNLAVNYIEGFHEELTLLEAYELVYLFIFNMVETIEETK